MDAPENSSRALKQNLLDLKKISKSSVKHRMVSRQAIQKKLSKMKTAEQKQKFLDSLIRSRKMIYDVQKGKFQSFSKKNDLGRKEEDKKGQRKYERQLNKTALSSTRENTKMTKSSLNISYTIPRGKTPGHCESRRNRKKQKKFKMKKLPSKIEVYQQLQNSSRRGISLTSRVRAKRRAAMTKLGSTLTIKGKREWYRNHIQYIQHDLRYQMAGEEGDPRDTDRQHNLLLLRMVNKQKTTEQVDWLKDKRKRHKQILKRLRNDLLAQHLASRQIEDDIVKYNIKADQKKKEKMDEKKKMVQLIKKSEKKYKTGSSPNSRKNNSSKKGKGKNLQRQKKLFFTTERLIEIQKSNPPKEIVSEELMKVAEQSWVHNLSQAHKTYQSNQTSSFKRIDHNVRQLMREQKIYEDKITRMFQVDHRNRRYQPRTRSMPKLRKLDGFSKLLSSMNKKSKELGHRTSKFSQAFKHQARKIASLASYKKLHQKLESPDSKKRHSKKSKTQKIQKKSPNRLNRSKGGQFKHRGRNHTVSHGHAGQQPSTLAQSAVLNHSQAPLNLRDIAISQKQAVNTAVNKRICAQAFGFGAPDFAQDLVDSILRTGQKRNSSKMNRHLANIRRELMQAEEREKAEKEKAAASKLKAQKSQERPQSHQTARQSKFLMLSLERNLQFRNQAQTQEKKFINAHKLLKERQEEEEKLRQKKEESPVSARKRMMRGQEVREVNVMDLVGKLDHRGSDSENSEDSRDQVLDLSSVQSEGENNSFCSATEQDLARLYDKTKVLKKLGEKIDKHRTHTKQEFLKIDKIMTLQKRDLHKVRIQVYNIFKKKLQQ